MLKCCGYTKTMYIFQVILHAKIYCILVVCLKIVKDFYRDVLTVFPEYKDKLQEYEIEFLMEDKHGEKLYNIVLKIIHNIFSIYYIKMMIFLKIMKNLNFLPSINFVEIWKDEDISDKTRETIWKYLQLILFSVSKNVNSQESFGDTAKLFEAINEDELKTKLEETMKDMEGWFNNNEMFGDISLNNMMDPSSINLNDFLMLKIYKIILVDYWMEN